MPNLYQHTKNGTEYCETPDLPLEIGISQYWCPILVFRTLGTSTVQSQLIYNISYLSDRSSAFLWRNSSTKLCKSSACCSWSFDSEWVKSEAAKNWRNKNIEIRVSSPIYEIKIHRLQLSITITIDMQSVIVFQNSLKWPEKVIIEWSVWGKTGRNDR